MLLLSFILSWWCCYCWHTNFWVLPCWAMWSCSLARCFELCVPNAACGIMPLLTSIKKYDILLCRASVHFCLCPALVTSNGQRVKNIWDRRWKASECETVWNTWYWILICPGLWVLMIRSTSSKFWNISNKFCNQTFGKLAPIACYHSVLMQQHARWYVHVQLHSCPATFMSIGLQRMQYSSWANSTTDDFVLLSQADIGNALMLVCAVRSAYAWQEISIRV